MGADLSAYGLRPMTAEQWLLHDRLILALRARWRDGYRRTLPIVRRSR